MSRKNLTIAVIAIFIFGCLFYLSTKRDSEIVVKKNIIEDQPYVSWQKISITEETENISVAITVPRIIIDNYNVKYEVNKTITRHIEYLKNNFISAVSTAAYKNVEASTLNINTEVLLITPRLISLAFTAAKHLAGGKDGDPEQTFLVFDLTKDKIWIERNELFRDNFAFSSAAEIINTSLLSGYQGEPSCDLLLAPKHNGLAASCIGIDRSRRKNLSIKGDIPVSLVQEFLAPSVLSDIIQQAAIDK